MHYRREIDGLRAVAVLPVILFHAGFQTLSGGFVGVDIFFVISGYLITSILIEEMESGDFSIARFYERRARRILPALFVVMLACLPFAYAWMLHSQWDDFSKSVVAVIFFSSNFLFWSESSYFGEEAELKPLLHTWSLAVEEQYYLIFPVFLFLVWRFGRNRAHWSVIIIAGLSLLLAEWGRRNAPTASFYLAPTRAWELLAGSSCAFLTAGRAQRSSNVLSAIGIGLIMFAIFFYDRSIPFPSLYAVAPVGGTMLVILFAARETWVARLLSMRPLVGIGLISYSAYLWHQPLFAFARMRSLTEPSAALMAGLAVLAMLLAWATWHWVERPFRKGARSVLTTRSGVFSASAAIGGKFVAIGLVGGFLHGCGTSGVASAQAATLDARLRGDFGLAAECNFQLNTSPNCQTSATPDVLLWGDSYAMHLVSGIVASEPGIALQQQTKSSCAPILGIAQLGDGLTKNWAEGCVAFNDAVLDWLRRNGRVKLVVLSTPFHGLLKRPFHIRDEVGLPGHGVEVVAQRLRATAEAVRDLGAQVVIVSPTPVSGWDIGQCLARRVKFGGSEDACDFPAGADAEAFELLRSVADTIPVYWLDKELCQAGICDPLQAGVMLYRDSGHLSREGSVYLGQSRDWMAEFRSMAR